MLTHRTHGSATRPAWHHQVEATDRRRIRHHAVPGLQVGTCWWCPPGDPTRPANAVLTWTTPPGTRQRRDVGECCALDAVTRLLADVERVCVEHSDWTEDAWGEDSAPSWVRTISPDWWLQVLSHRDGTYSWASYGPGWRPFRNYTAGEAGLPSAEAAAAAADQYAAKRPAVTS